MDKIVIVKRRPYNGTKPDEFVAADKHSIGGALSPTGNGLLKGIDYQEERILMPLILGIPANHTDFTTKSNNWYADLKKHVPVGGIRLNVSLFDDTKELGEDLGEGKGLNFPKNPADYILYRYCKVYSRVAPDLDSVYGSIDAIFYLFSETENIERENERTQAGTKSVREYAKISEKEGVVNQVLRVLSANYEFVSVNKPEIMDLMAKQNVLFKVATEQPIEFLKVVGDKELETRAEIYEMIDKGILEVNGNTIVFMNEELGKNIEQAIAYIKSAANSKTYAQLKGKLGQVNEEK